MNKYEDQLIAVLLGDAAAAPEVERWLQTEAGRRELTAYQQTLDALERVYGETPAPRPVVHYAALETPIGPVFAAATEAGLVRVSFLRSEASFVAELRRQLKAQAVKSPEKLAGIMAQLRDYLKGKRRAFDVPVDLRLATPFQRRVLQAALGIPRGQTATYADIARRIGQPGAARAVGQALGRNPVPIVVPCHRVLASDGSLRGYSGGGGVRTKARLLALEGVRLS